MSVPNAPRVNPQFASPYNPDRPMCYHIAIYLTGQPVIDITGYAAEAVFRAIEIQLTQGPEAIAEAIKKALENSKA